MKFERRNLFSTNHNVFILKPDSLVDFYLILIARQKTASLLDLHGDEVTQKC